MILQVFEPYLEPQNSEGGLGVAAGWRGSARRSLGESTLCANLRGFRVEQTHGGTSAGTDILNRGCSWLVCLVCFELGGLGWFVSLYGCLVWLSWVMLALRSASTKQWLQWHLEEMSVTDAWGNPRGCFIGGEIVTLNGPNYVEKGVMYYCTKGDLSIFIFFGDTFSLFIICSMWVVWLELFGPFRLWTSSGWWFQIVFIIIPKIGEMIQFDENIFSEWVENTN